MARSAGVWSTAAQSKRNGWRLCRGRSTASSIKNSANKPLLYTRRNCEAEGDRLPLHRGAAELRGENMKKTLLLIATTALLTSRSESALAQTADEVVEKHLAAIGGREALGKVTSRITSGCITVSTPGGDASGTVESYAKAPNKSRALIKVDFSSFGAWQHVVGQR